MFSVDYRFLTRLTLVVNILAFIAFFFLGVVDDKVLLLYLLICCLAMNIMMFFMLSDFKFYKNKNSNEDSKESEF